jgi:hypothetical protein
MYLTIGEYFAAWVMMKERPTKYIFKVNHIFRISILLLHVSVLQERHLQWAQSIIRILLAPWSLCSCSTETCSSKIDILNIWFTFKMHFVGLYFIITGEKFKPQKRRSTMFIQRAKPIWKIGYLDNQHPDKCGIQLYYHPMGWQSLIILLTPINFNLNIRSQGVFTVFPGI